MSHPMNPFQNAAVASAVDGSLQQIPIWQYFPPPRTMSHTMAPQRYQQAQSMGLPYQYAANPQMKQLYGGHMTFSRQELVKTSIRDHLRVTLTPHQNQALAWLSWREEHHPRGGILADEAVLGKIRTMISLVLLKKSEAGGSLQQTLVGQQPPLLISHPMPQHYYQQAPVMYPLHQYAENTFIQSSCALVICPASLIDQWAEEVERCCKPGQLNIYLYRGPNRERQPEELAKYDMVIASYRMVWTDLKSLLNNVNGVEAAMGNQPALLRVIWDRIILHEAHNIKNPLTETAILICKLEARARWAVTSFPIQNNTMEMLSLLRFLRCDELRVWETPEKLHTLVKDLILRRTKDQETSSGNPIVSLPEKKIHTHEIYLSSEERKIYDQLDQQYRSAPYKLVIQQRLMQCCSHLSLLGVLTDGIKLDPITGQVQPNMICYTPSFLSTKIKFVIYRLMEIRAAGPADRPMKSVLVSQWTRMLDVVAIFLSWAGFQYWSIRRAMSPKERHVAMVDFNTNPWGPEVMLVSLKAGRVGLNLIGGNNLFLLDMHWNPALEDIVCDSIWRVGQMRSVYIHKFVCVDTIEERILEQQDKKRQLAKDVLTGSKKVPTPSQADLEFLMGDPYEHEA